MSSSASMAMTLGARSHWTTNKATDVGNGRNNSINVRECVCMCVYVRRTVIRLGLTGCGTGKKLICASVRAYYHWDNAENDRRPYGTGNKQRRQRHSCTSVGRTESLRRRPSNNNSRIITLRIRVRPTDKKKVRACACVDYAMVWVLRRTRQR